jgi:Na+-translocating ferredoxin:NAD+ oxidoreductase RnfE subunit
MTNIAILRLWGLWLVLGLTPGMAVAAQQILIADQGTLLDDIETVLGEEQIEIMEAAETDRFAIIYATRANGSHVTITLAQTPHEETQITLLVASDSPEDKNFDQFLLQRLLNAQ